MGKPRGQFGSLLRGAAQSNEGMKDPGAKCVLYTLMGMGMLVSDMGSRIDCSILLSPPAACNVFFIACTSSAEKTRANSAKRISPSPSLSVSLMRSSITESGMVRLNMPGKCVLSSAGSIEPELSASIIRKHRA